MTTSYSKNIHFPNFFAYHTLRIGEMFFEVQGRLFVDVIILKAPSSILVSSKKYK